MPVAATERPSLPVVRGQLKWAAELPSEPLLS